MSLVAACLLTGLALLVLGSFLALGSPRFFQALERFPRSRTATLVLFGLATVLVLYEVTQLGEADFGRYRWWLFAFFAALAGGAWFLVPDFLGIRGLAVLLLLVSAELLRAAYLEPPASRLFLVGFVYFVILAALYLAAVPYRFRDGVEGLRARPVLGRVLGTFTALYGVGLCVLPLSFAATSP